MQIDMTISTHTLGDHNTADDNLRYAAAVKGMIQYAYPDASVSVGLVSNVTAGSCWVSDDSTGEILEHVTLIAGQVWDKMD